MNIDKTRKVVSIVLMVLMIGTMVFNVFHIVGHCADSSSSGSVTSFPLYYGDGFGVAGPIPLDSVISYCNALDVGTQMPNHNRLITIYEYTDSSNFTCFYYGNPDFLASDGAIRNEPTFTLTDRFIVGAFGYRYTITCTNGTFSATYGGRGYTVYCNLNNVLETNAAGGFSYKSGTYLDYPLWFSEGYSLNFADTGNAAFVYPTSYEGHSKGGSIAQYTFDQTDETAPSDPSAVAGSGGWLSKILGGLNKLNKTVGDGFTNLVDNLQSFFNPIFGAFEQQIDSFKSSIESKLDDIILALGGDLNTSDTSLSDTFLSAFQGSKSYGVVTTYNQGKGLVSDLFNAVPTPQTLRFEFDLPTMNLSGGHSQGGSSSPNAVKPYGNKLVMDFGWYENVRSIVFPFIIAWLYAGMLIWLLRAIPGFISGSPSINTRSVSDGSPIINGHNEVYEYTDYQGHHHKKPIFRL